MWLIWKVYTWFILRQWNHHLTKCKEVYKNDPELSPIAMADIAARIPWTIINALPSEKYHYHSVVTANATIVDIERWLYVCHETLLRYNACSADLIEMDRPNDTYIPQGLYDRIDMTDPMETTLDSFMTVKNQTANAVYLNGVLVLIHKIACEISKIEDTIDRKYFIRKTAPFMDDIYGVITVMIEAGTLHGK